MKSFCRFIPGAMMYLAMVQALVAQTPVPPAGGDGLTTDTAFEMNEPGHLSWLQIQTANALTAGHYYRLTGDIDISTVTQDGGFVSIGTEAAPFLGTLNGNGFAIRGLMIERDAVAGGLFGTLGGSSAVHNVALEGGSVSVPNTASGVTDPVAAALAAHVAAGAVVSGCSSTVNVASTHEDALLGGLVGVNAGSVTNCFAMGSVRDNVTTATGVVGGFVARNTGSVVNSYSTGAVRGIGPMSGGFCGANMGSISFCYWDLDTSDWSSSFGGIAKTTAQMKQATTFLHWDTVNVWGLDSTINAGYPYLRAMMKGSLTVVIAPQGAADAGATWFLNGIEYAGSTTVSVPVPSTQTVSFKDVPEWVAPAAMNVSIPSAEAVMVTGTYTATPSWYVSATDGNDTNDGLTPQTALKTIACALSKSGTNGDKIYVLPGVYGTDEGVHAYWGDNRVYIDKSGIRLIATGTAAETVILGDDIGTGVRCVVANAAATGVELSGFTLTGASLLTNEGGGALNVTLRDCIVTGNAAPFGGGAYNCDLYNCTISGNTATYGGGAYLCVADACKIVGNMAQNGAGAYWTDMVNCVVSGNVATSAGGGLHTGSARNCTIAGNSAQTAGGASNATLVGSIVSNNTAASAANVSGCSATYSCVPTAALSGIGNITDNPQLVNAAAGNFRLNATSPCIGKVAAANSPATDIMGNPRTMPCDMGAYAAQAVAPQTGQLKVNLSPAEAVTSGAAWLLNGVEYGNGVTVSDMPNDMPILVTFKTINGWNAPEAQTCTIGANTLTTLDGTYTTYEGSIRVLLAPAEAVAAGVKWIINGTEYDSGATVDGLIANTTHTVTFKGVPAWAAPAAQSVIVRNQTVHQLTGTFTQVVGSVRVTLSPAVITASAAWRINGGSWQNSDTTVANLPIGNYEITFKDVSNWRTPTPQTVAVTDGQVTAVSATYGSPFDMVLTGGDFSAGTVTPLAPGAKVDIRWAVTANELTADRFWCEVFASKSGGFDQVRFGSTLTNSYRQTGLQSLTQVVAPSNQTLTTLPDGVYSLMPVVNRGSLAESTRIAEANYVNNWLTIPGKRLSVRSAISAQIDLQMVDAQSTKDPNNANRVTVTGTVRNNSSVALPSPGCWVEVFYGKLTAEGTLDPSGTIGAGQLISALAAGAEAPFTLSGTVSDGVDKRALAVIVDSTDIVPEVNEVNNSILWYQPGVLPSPKDNGIDLVMLDLSVNSAQLAPNQVKPGDKLNFSVRVKNNGSTILADRVWLEIFASQDGGVSFMRGSTATASERLYAPMPGGTAEYNFSQTLNALGDGMYTLVAVVNRDGAGNNPGDITPLNNRVAFAGGRISMSTSSVTGSVNITWVAPPVFTQVGTRMTVTGTITNTGDTTSRSFWTEAFVGRLDGTTGFFTRGSALASGVLCNGLAPGATQDVSLSGTVPSGRVVGILTDSTDLVAESDETDNYDYSAIMQ